MSKARISRTSPCPDGCGKDDFRLIEKIGHSSEGADIYRAEYVPSETVVAVKFIDMDLLTDSDLASYHREVGVMKGLSHPYVVQYYASFVDETRLWVVMEYHAHGSLRALLPFIKLSENDIGYALACLLSALAYFHETDRIHRAVEAKHLLVSKSGDVRLSDFSMATILLQGGARKEAMTVVGRGAWTAPEVHLSTTGYNSACDIWSVGMTAIELARGQAPWENHNELKIVQLMHDEVLPLQSISDCSSHFQEFVTSCLQIDPEKRPSAKKLLDHKFIKGRKKRSDKWVQKLEELQPLAIRFRDRESKKAEEMQKMASSLTPLPAHPSSGTTTPQQSSDPSPGQWEFSDSMAMTAEDDGEVEKGFTPTRQSEGGEEQEAKAASQAAHAQKNAGAASVAAQVEAAAEEVEAAEAAVDAASVLATLPVVPIAESNNVPVSISVGESDLHYVVTIRSPADTQLNLTFETGVLIVSGVLPPLPSVQGVRRTLVAAPSAFKFSVPLEKDITEMSNAREGDCLILHLSKAS
eukprot:TRINITY_DN2105_c0_g1_i1.p1 TRINITY_DN2105_c0_g1~~TRINITY_DN2105_c0_g1_i1.p1  ORF type:complete len:525 (-),score=188.38 TRINITY_DN2105_c0_g1_i1:202-1776(-)